MQKTLPTLSVLLLSACGSATPAPHAGPVASPEIDAEQLLASVDGIPVRFSDLSPELLAELKKAENEALQRRFNLLWAGMEEALSNKLIEREADRRGLSVEAFHAEEIDSKIETPTAEEVRQFYDDNKDFIPVPFEAATEVIASNILQERRSEKENALLERLRSSADIRHAIEPPDLPRFDVDVGESPQWGSPNARVTLIEFSDFECPFCARAGDLITKLKELYPDSLRVVFRDFPLRRHKNARPAARAARCAHEQKKFWPYHDKLFANAHALTDKDLVKYAADLGLNAESFASCVSSKRTDLAVAADLEAGRKYGVEGTPAIFINGMKLVGLLPLPMMQAIIERELTR